MKRISIFLFVTVMYGLVILSCQNGNMISENGPALETKHGLQSVNIQRQKIDCTSLQGQVPGANDPDVLSIEALKVNEVYTYNDGMAVRRKADGLEITLPMNSEQNTSVVTYEIPNDRLYSIYHVWIQTGNGDAGDRIGVTDFYVNYELQGTVLYVGSKGLGGFLRGTAIADIETTHSAGEILMPVDGVLYAYNYDLDDEPLLLNIFPLETWVVFGEICQFEEDDFDELGLMTASEYATYINRILN